VVVCRLSPFLANPNGLSREHDSESVRFTLGMAEPFHFSPPDAVDSLGFNRRRTAWRWPPPRLRRADDTYNKFLSAWELEVQIIAQVTPTMAGMGFRAEELSTAEATVAGGSRGAASLHMSLFL
jgi:hypothetical protein